MLASNLSDLIDDQIAGIHRHRSDAANGKSYVAPSDLFDREKKLRLLKTLLNRLTVEGVGSLLGMTPSTIRSYVARGYLPRGNPCPCCGHGSTWTEEFIRDWQAARPGRTGRPRVHG